MDRWEQASRRHRRRSAARSPMAVCPRRRRPVCGLVALAWRVALADAAGKNRCDSSGRRSWPRPRARNSGVPSCAFVTVPVHSKDRSARAWRIVNRAVNSRSPRSISSSEAVPSIVSHRSSRTAMWRRGAATFDVPAPHRGSSGPSRVTVRSPACSSLASPWRAVAPVPQLVARGAAAPIVTSALTPALARGTEPERNGSEDPRRWTRVIIGAVGTPVTDMISLRRR